MCYESLTNGTAVERPLSTLLRAEAPSAVKDGVVAAALVTVALVAGGVPTAWVVATAVGTLALTALAHELVLVAGVALVRWRTGEGRPEGTAETA
jgi:hypothetical protein